MKQNLFNINYNNSSKVSEPHALECKKINRKINNRKLFEVKNEKVPHILNIFEQER